MKVLITGASSGIGEAFAEEFNKRDYNLILTARRKDRLEEIKKRLNDKTEIICADLADLNHCFDLYEKVKKQDIDIIINNAGFGVFGEFEKTDLKKELNMLNVNIDAVHLLTKLFLRDFLKKNEGYILNTASSAAFFPGPLFSSYYASKAYVLRLSVALYEELKRKHSNVYVGALCPGPVSTEFNDAANANGFASKPLTAQYVAQYAIKKMFKRKPIIIPGTLMKLTNCFGSMLPPTVQAKLAYHFQKIKQ